LHGAVAGVILYTTIIFEGRNFADFLARQLNMSKLYTLVNSFDAISGAAFDGGSGGGSGGGWGGGRKAAAVIKRNKEKKVSSVKPSDFGRSHPSAMTSAQYNHAYTAKSTSSSCADKAIIGGIVAGASTPGSVHTKIGTAAGGASVGLAACVISKF